MPKTFVPQIVCANRLLTGEVVYLAAGGGWSPSPGDAAVAGTAEEATALLGAAQARPGEVVSAELIEVAPGPGGPVPLRLRERIKSRGPTHRADLARQSPTPASEDTHVPL